MILTADSSVWIAYLRGERTRATEALDAALNSSLTTDLVLLDVVLMAILRGCRSQRELRLTDGALGGLPVQASGGQALARAAANIYRQLRSKGITVRSPIDLLVGAWCIENQVPLLHADRDFDGMVQHHGLRVVAAPPLAH